MDRRAWILSRCRGFGRILDVGGRDGWIWRDSGLDVVVLDMEVFGYRPSIRGDSHELPFRDGSFPAVVVAEVLEHVSNPIRVLRECVRVASEKVILTVPYEFAWHPLHKPFSNPSHVRHYTPRLLREHLRYAGCLEKAKIGYLYYDGWCFLVGEVVSYSPLSGSLQCVPASGGPLSPHHRGPP